MKYYCLMDGRYVLDPDRALVNETCDTLEEAVNSINDYGADTCIVSVDADTGKEALLYILPNRYAYDLDEVLRVASIVDK